MYYTCKIEISLEGSETRDMRSFDNFDGALTRLHSDMASKINKVKSILVIIIDGTGNTLRREYWAAPTDDEEVI